ncbi:gliding machinery protein P42 [Mycoplasmopsis pulmonis]|uniref:gliding machinery protein P42 n=1 Tax=Mycoplasmopsis pulmonis TaxID=2107 RepID=UPI002ACE02FC|nr:hypothetical protein [Mycoplasmopsis pulmonis]MDZ7293180.1 hypothetical protein [Mycoplasmopsis pulmonis]
MARELKNYIPNVLVVVLGEWNFEHIYNLDFKIKQNAKFLRFGSKKQNISNLNIEEHFYLWHPYDKNSSVNYKKHKSPAQLFEENKIELDLFFKNADLMVVLSKTRDEESLEYVSFLSKIAKANNILTMHLLLKNLLWAKTSVKLYSMALDHIRDNKNILIDLEEINLLSTYENIEIPKRDRYVDKSISQIMKSLIAPFYETVLNPNLYAKIKYEILTRKIEKLPEKWYVALGSSNEKQDRFEKALFAALANPTFRGTFNSAKKFFIIISGTFISENKIAKTLNILKQIVIPGSEVIVSRVVEDYLFENVINVAIIARSADKIELVDDPEQINSLIRETMAKVYSLVDNEETREIILNKPFQKTKIIDQ